MHYIIITKKKLLGLEKLAICTHGFMSKGLLDKKRYVDNKINYD